MAQRERPTEDEIDQFVDLYDELGTIRAVSEHDDVEWSYESVRTWLHERGILGDDGDGDMEVPDDPGPGGGDDGDDGSVATTAPPEELREQKSPNDVLAEVVDADPGVGEKVVDYLESRMEALGVLGTNDIRGAFQQLSGINNKHQTVGRILQEYQARCNRLLRENPNLQYDDQWAMLLMKETGNDPRQGGSGQMMSGSGGITQPQQQTAPGGQMGGGQGGIGAPRQPQSQPGHHAVQPQQPQQRRGQQAPSRQPGGGRDQPAEPQGNTQETPASPDSGPEGSNDSGRSEFEEMAMEYFRSEVLEGDDEEEETTSATDELTEAIQAVKQIEDMRDDLVGEEETDSEDTSQAVQTLDQRLARLEGTLQEAVSESSEDKRRVETEGKMSDMLEVAQVAQEFEDPELVEQVIRLQSDPDIMEAQAELEEAKGSANLKQELISAISPEVTEKAVDSVFQIVSGLNTAVEQETQGNAQPQPQAQRPPEPQENNVEVVEDQDPSTPEGSPNRPSDFGDGDDEEETTAVETVSEEAADGGNTEENEEEDEA